MDIRTNHRALERLGGRGSFAAQWLFVGLALALALALWLPTTGTQAAEVYPVVVVDDDGTEVTIAAPPERIISLSPANTEIVFALGAGDRLVGGTEYDDYPAAAADLLDVATFTHVIMERVVEVDPSLVLAGGSGFTAQADIDRMRELGYPVVVTYPSDVDGILADIELIGTSIGEAEAAQALTAEMASQLAAIADTAAAFGETPRTFYQVGSEPDIYGPADDSFLADMITLAGGEPVTTGDAVSWTMPVERLIEADPEVIIVGDALFGVCPEDVVTRPAWTSLAAVRDGNVRAIGFADVTRPGPRLPEALAAIARAIHPTIELPGMAAHPDPCAVG